MSFPIKFKLVRVEVQVRRLSYLAYAMLLNLKLKEIKWGNC